MVEEMTTGTQYTIWEEKTLFVSFVSMNRSNILFIQVRNEFRYSVAQNSRLTMNSGFSLTISPVACYLLTNIRNITHVWYTQLNIGSVIHILCFIHFSCSHTYYVIELKQTKGNSTQLSQLNLNTDANGMTWMNEKYLYATQNVCVAGSGITWW